MTLTPGDKVGRYKILAPIGAGGMGEVYRASDSSLGREVALKILPEEMSSDKDRLARFYREARSAAALNHPNIVTLHSVEESNGVHFLTMELVDGQPLDHMLPAGGLTPQAVIEIAAAIADAMSAAHDKGVVHRDLKPANIMITSDGRVKVLDFGLAKELAATRDEAETRTYFGETQAGVVLGTPPYMSPEQISASPVDHRSDIFSLGIIAYEMLTGHRPFEGRSAIELAASILRDPAPPVSKPDVPEQLVRLIEGCLAKQPSDRIQSARTLASGLRAIGNTVVALDSNSGESADTGFWIAVSSIKSTGMSAELATLADGLTEEITTGLTRFSYLHVIRHGSTPARRARYILDGNLRLVGATIRLSVQLTESISGMHIWAETFTRPFRADSVFDLQDELAVRVVTSTADAYGALPRSMSQAVRGKPIDQLTPYEALLRSFTYAERVSADEHASAMQALERALKAAPDFSDGWAMLSLLRTDGYIHGFDASEDALDRALAAARTAVDKNPANHKAHQSLAWALCFRKEYLAAIAAAERTIALNPFDACAKVYMGQLMVSAGAWERGVALVRHALPLNPNHPGWYWYPLYCDCYRRGDYRGALDYALQMNMPRFPLTHVVLAAAYGQLGDQAGSANSIRDLLALRPDYAAVAEKELGKICDAPLTAALIEGLRKAGLGSSGAATGNLAADGFWVAVLPFRSTGANPELPALADALAEEITNGLSRFSYLRVIARGSTLRYARHDADVRTAAKELGASYVMEGTLRQASNRMRLAVQLVDASTGAQMWAETYERAFDPGAVFEIQDDLASHVVSTVADQDGVLPQSMAEALRSKREEDLTPQEAMLRSLRYWKTFTREEHALARRILERAVEVAPSRGDCHALLSHLYSVEYWDLLNPRQGSLDRALAAAKRAVDVAPTNNLSYWALALALFFKRDRSGFRIAAQRAIELNPMDGSVVAFMGHLIAYSGEWDRGVEIAEKGSGLNPHHGGWHGLLAVYDAYQRRDYQRSLDAALRLDMGGHFQESASRAAAYAQLGRIAEAGAALRELLSQIPDFPVHGHQFYRKLLVPEMVDHVLNGLRKAGLDIGSAIEEREESSGPEPIV